MRSRTQPGFAVIAILAILLVILVVGWNLWRGSRVTEIGLGPANLKVGGPEDLTDKRAAFHLGNAIANIAFVRNRFSDPYSNEVRDFYNKSQKDLKVNLSLLKLDVDISDLDFTFHSHSIFSYENCRAASLLDQRLNDSKGKVPKELYELGLEIEGDTIAASLGEFELDPLIDPMSATKVALEDIYMRAGAYDHTEKRSFDENAYIKDAQVATDSKKFNQAILLFLSGQQARIEQSL